MAASGHMARWRVTSPCSRRAPTGFSQYHGWGLVLQPVNGACACLLYSLLSSMATLRGGSCVEGPCTTPVRSIFMGHVHNPWKP